MHGKSDEKAETGTCAQVREENIPRMHSQSDDRALHGKMLK